MMFIVDVFKVLKTCASMRNAFQLFELFFFFFSLSEKIHIKKFSFLLFSVSLAQPKTSVFTVCVPSKASFSILPSCSNIQIFCFLPFFKRTVFDEKMKKSQKSQKCKVKSRDTLSLNFPKVVILTHEYSSTLLHKQQCLLLLNKSRPSPASRPPRFKYVSLSFVFPFRDPIRSDRARASSSSWNYLFAYPTLYTIRENKMQNDTLSLSLSDPKPSSLLRSRRTKTVKGARRLCSLRVGIVLFLDPSAREEARALEREIGRKVLTLWASPRENLSFFL